MRWDLPVRLLQEFFFIDDGQIKEEAALEEFFEHPKDPRLQEFLSKIL